MCIDARYRNSALTFAFPVYLLCTPVLFHMSLLRCLFLGPRYRAVAMRDEIAKLRLVHNQ